MAISQPDKDTERIPEFQFAGFWVDRVQFSTSERAPRDPNEVRANVENVQLQFKIGSAINPETLRSQVTLTTKVIADPKWQPYEILVELTGQFLAVKGTATAQDLESFSRTNVPSILFPYVRDIVHRLTADGRYGVVRLNPVNMAAVFQPDGWQPVKPSSAPEQPSEQSPSDAKD